MDCLQGLTGSRIHCREVRFSVAVSNCLPMDWAFAADPPGSLYASPSITPSPRILCRISLVEPTSVSTNSCGPRLPRPSQIATPRPIRRKMRRSLQPPHHHHGHQEPKQD